MYGIKKCRKAIFKFNTWFSELSINVKAEALQIVTPCSGHQCLPHRFDEKAI
jgi:hypothetical protein